MINFDSWMEDRINGDYGPELDRLEALVDEAEFLLGPPEADDLDEATTNGSSIEVEVEDVYESGEDYHDGQPSEYDEWQDYYGGDEYQHGTYGDY